MGNSQIFIFLTFILMCKAHWLNNYTLTSILTPPWLDVIAVIVQEENVFLTCLPLVPSNWGFPGNSKNFGAHLHNFSHCFHLRYLFLLLQIVFVILLIIQDIPVQSYIIIMRLTSAVRCLSIDEKFCVKIRMIDPNKVIDIVAYNTSIDCSRVVIFVGVLSIHDNAKKIFIKD